MVIIYWPENIVMNLLLTQMQETETKVFLLVKLN